MAVAQTPQISLQATAVVSGAFLSGAMMGLSLVAVPVFLDTDTQSAHLLAHFVRLYHYGHRIMPTLAVGTLALYAISASKARIVGGVWKTPLLAGLTTISLVPFTWITMSPTNYALFGLNDQIKAGENVDFDHVRTFILKWNALHVIRSLFPLIGAVLGGRHVLRQLGF